MNVLVTGATGFIGRMVVLRLQRDGHRVTAWVRDPARARQVLGADVALVHDSAEQDDTTLLGALGEADGVVNLAGEPVAGRRWTAARKRRIRESRIGLTERLVRAMGQLERPPAVLVSASAVGYYGDRGDEELDETAPAGADFLAAVCADWELAAARAAELGVRVVLPRIGIVLGAGGALERMVPLFRAGLGGRLGHGRQWMPWIHIEDLVELLTRALTSETLEGPINAVAPGPVQNRTFTRLLGAALGRPAVLPVPRFALRLAFGAAARVLLAGQRALPVRLQQHGFEFRFDRLEQALDELLSPAADLELGPLGRASLPEASYLDRRRPRYLLRQRMRIDAPLEQVFAFFSRAENLGLLTPADMQFEILRQPPEMNEGAVIDYRIKLGPLALRWRTVIERWERMRVFVDAQHRGPYRCWWHEHHFHADGERTVMEDRVYYAPPLGVIGRLVHRLFIADKLRAIFGFRARAVRLRFGAEELARLQPLESAA